MRDGSATRCSLFASATVREVVFHAAAHKHVPLMEGCPQEAVQQQRVRHAQHSSRGRGRLRRGEIRSDLDRQGGQPHEYHGREQAAVRDDACSPWHSARTPPSLPCVSATFSAQTARSSRSSSARSPRAAPSRVTDARIIRYFMTIPEAASLVLEAGAMAKRNELFVLNMGKPVKILDLAENLIRLSGYEPYVGYRYYRNQACARAKSSMRSCSSRAITQKRRRTTRSMSSISRSSPPPSWKKSWRSSASRWKRKKRTRSAPRSTASSRLSASRRRSTKYRGIR